MMKALSVQQPWAELIVCHDKDVENRTWPTTYRGRVAIHASAGLLKKDLDNLKWLYSKGKFHIDPSKLKLTLGAIIGTVEIYNCVTSSSSRYFNGPYGFLLYKPMILPKPIKVKGSLGLWRVPEDIEAEIRQQLGPDC
jgi:hypothetical protein